MLLVPFRIKIFRHIGCNVIGRKFDGSSAGPFLCIRMVVALDHATGICLLFQACFNMMVRNVRKNGHLFSTITESWSSGHGHF